MSSSVCSPAAKWKQSRRAIEMQVQVSVYSSTNKNNWLEMKMKKRFYRFTDLQIFLLQIKTIIEEQWKFKFKVVLSIYCPANKTTGLKWKCKSSACSPVTKMSNCLAMKMQIQHNLLPT